MIRLFDYFRSTACYRVRIALNYKGQHYEKIPIHLINNGGEQFSSSYQAINPQCLIPSMQIGPHLITQSLAILEYLEETYPTPPLLPKSTYEKALVRAFALSIVADIHPLNNLRVLKYLTDELHVNDAQKNRWYKHWVTKGLHALEAQLHIYNLAQDFCFGNTPSFADVCLIPQLFNARRFNCDLSKCTTLLRIENNCQKLTAFSAAVPIEAVA